MTKENIEKLGRLIDQIDNFKHALNIPVPADIHVKGFKESMPEWVEALKQIFIEETGENPWGIG